MEPSSLMNIDGLREVGEENTETIPQKEHE
jgi:hypothetical protein